MNETVEEAMARIDAVRNRSNERRAAERAFEVGMLVVAETVRVASSTEPREDVPFEFLQARLGARLNVALIGWLTRRHPRVTKDDREGPSSWTQAPLGSPLIGDAPTGVTDSPTDDPACLAAFDGFGYAYPDRVRVIEQARARYEDTWISVSTEQLDTWRRRSLHNLGMAQRAIDAWKAGEQ